MLGTEDAVQELVAGGLMGVEARIRERSRRVRLNVGDEEVTLALREDDSVRGTGFG